MAQDPSLYPQRFGNYVLLRKLAKGGMAELFLASVRGGGQRLVIKRVLPSYTSEPDFLKMFLNEARIAAQLSHPNIVQIFDLGLEGEHVFLAMEFVDGFDLDALTRVAGGRLPPDIVAGIGAATCEALHYANHVTDRAGKPLNVVHRDVTPGNVMITRSGVVKLVDFGVAKAAASIDKTRPGVVKGKFRYMSPEQIAFKELDGRSDLFSLGVLLYEVTTGQRPFERKNVLDTVHAITSWNPPAPHTLVPGYPPELSKVILKALEKDRDRRYRSGKEMRQALEAAPGRAVGPPEIAAFVADLARRNPDRLPPPNPFDFYPDDIAGPLDARSLPTDPLRVARPRASAIGDAPREAPPRWPAPLAPTKDVLPEEQDEAKMRTSQISGAEVQRLLAEAELRRRSGPSNQTVSSPVAPPVSRGAGTPLPSFASSRPGISSVEVAPGWGSARASLPTAPGERPEGLGEGEEATASAGNREVWHSTDPRTASTLRTTAPRRPEPGDSGDRTLDGPFYRPPGVEFGDPEGATQSDPPSADRPGRANLSRGARPMILGILAVLLLVALVIWIVFGFGRRRSGPNPGEAPNLVVPAPHP
jgi:serine/threonine-protein kinase